MEIVEVKNLNFSYLSGENHNTLILEDINLEFSDRNIVVILGESGCGKTTFLNLIAGFLKPTSGNIMIDGQVITNPHYSRTLIFQRPCLLPWLTVKENIAFGCRIRGEKRNLSKRIKKIVSVLGLEGTETYYPESLSEGMAQRVALARALIGNPELILLDEPFGSLDFNNRANMQNEMIYSWLSEKCIVIFVTHDIEEAIILGKKIVILGGQPATIRHIIDVNFDYPRDLADRKIEDLKSNIREKFKSIRLFDRKYD